MAYQLELTRTAAKDIRDLPGRFRIRLDRWRVIYRVDDDAELITLLRVRLKTGPETYAGLDDDDA